MRRSTRKFLVDERDLIFEYLFCSGASFDVANHVEIQGIIDGQCTLGLLIRNAHDDKAAVVSPIELVRERFAVAFSPAANMRCGRFVSQEVSKQRVLEVT